MLKYSLLSIMLPRTQERTGLRFALAVQGEMSMDDCHIIGSQRKLRPHPDALAMVACFRLSTIYRSNWPAIHSSSHASPKSERVQGENEHELFKFTKFQQFKFAFFYFFVIFT